MPIAHFHKATDPATEDEVHINTDAVLFVEEPPASQIGRTAIQVMGLQTDGIRITEPLDLVLAQLPALTTTLRHYHAGPPPEGASVLHIATHNVSYVVPNVPHTPTFWTIHFKDASELRVVHPLPADL
ncbi:hypothetical protein [Rhodoferax saidenbachensis]|uniref:Uncharacterized protein n=1 Tax=Rhodoferax saidenbachensis TaxID=1484693 RepID=A0A1P8KAT4_9BURK|nr:hypothetical protein [Rhodoferax saidenbachensis]APW43090.1 hypothetical protein RS694_11505 [Rhodoferax saidenbachensis]